MHHEGALTTSRVHMPSWQPPVYDVAQPRQGGREGPQPQHLPPNTAQAWHVPGGAQCDGDVRRHGMRSPVMASGDEDATP